MDIEIFKKKNEKSEKIKLYTTLNNLQSINEGFVNKFCDKVKVSFDTQFANVHNYLIVYLNFWAEKDLKKDNVYFYSFQNKEDICELKIDYNKATIFFNDKNYKITIAEKIKEIEELECNTEIDIVELFKKEIKYSKKVIKDNMRVLQNIEYEGFTLELENINTRETNQFKTLVDVLDYIISVN